MYGEIAMQPPNLISGPQTPENPGRNGPSHLSPLFNIASLVGSLVGHARE